MSYSKWRDRPFRVDGSDVTLTKYVACAQQGESTEIAQSSPPGKAPYTKPLEALQLKTVWGMIWIYMEFSGSHVDLCMDLGWKFVGP